MRDAQADQLAQGYPTLIDAHLATQILGNQAESTAFQNGLTAFGVPANAGAAPNFGGWGIEQLQMQTLYRAAYSQNQLRELLAMFWAQHFSTNYDTLVAYLSANPPAHNNGGLAGNLLDNIPGLTGTNAVKAAQAAAYLKFLEFESFRTNALGSFRNLLEASAKSPAMLIYLDNVTNNSTGSMSFRPNENYARELIELHTLGVSPYSGAPYRYDGVDDPRKLGFCFTGWGVGKSATAPHYVFAYDATKHRDYDPVVEVVQPLLFMVNSFGTYGSLALATSGANSGLGQGNRVLDYLAGGLESRRFICSKLIEFFVGYRPMDTFDSMVPTMPPFTYPVRRLALNPGLAELDFQSLLTQCENDAVWLAGGVQGNIAEVVRTIVMSPLFRNSAVRWSRTKNPLEYTASLLRAYDARLPRVFNGRHELRNAVTFMENAGQSPHRHPSPDGHPLDSFKLASSSSYLHRSMLALSLHHDFQFMDPTGDLGGYRLRLPASMSTDHAAIDWYPLHTMLPALFFTGNPSNLSNITAYLQNYPPAAPTLDIGNKAAVVARTFDLLFQGDIAGAATNNAIAHLAKIESRADIGVTMSAWLAWSNPNTNPSWNLGLDQQGRALTRFLAYAAALPQFQLK